MLYCIKINIEVYINANTELVLTFMSVNIDINIDINSNVKTLTFSFVKERNWRPSLVLLCLLSAKSTRLGQSGPNAPSPVMEVR